MNHDTLWRLHGHSNASLRDFGGWGVYLFFAISGILICGRILDDEQKTGRIDLRAFYLRRLFRIQPAALCYLATIALLMLFHIAHESLQAWFGGLFLYTNYLWHAGDLSGRMAFVGHFWTLAVEEHFYLLLSLLLVSFRRNRIVLFTAVILALLLAQSAATFSPDVSSRRTFWTLQYLLIPALLALLLRVPRMNTLAVRLLRPWAVFTTVALLAIAHQVQRHGLAHWHTRLIANQAWLLIDSMMLWVVATMLHPRSLSTRFLELAPLRFVGRLSYSIYLWHVLFFVPVHPEVGITSPTLLFLSGRPWKYLATALCALLSYFLVEKPLIRFGHRLAPPATPGHSDLAAFPPGASY